jgi:hypothetical protein
MRPGDELHGPVELGVGGFDAAPYPGENSEILLCDVIEEQFADVVDVLSIRSA